MSWYEENLLAKREEYIKCRKDPMYFFENYVTIEGEPTSKHGRRDFYRAMYQSIVYGK